MYIAVYYIAIYTIMTNQWPATCIVDILSFLITVYNIIQQGVLRIHLHMVYVNFQQPTMTNNHQLCDHNLDTP